MTTPSIPCSRNQIQHTARKATRGAGLPWGLADDAGYAVRWLCDHGLDGAAALVNWLDEYRERGYVATAPAQWRGVWRGRGGVTNPLAVGAALSDCLARPDVDGAVDHFTGPGTDHGTDHGTESGIDHPTESGIDPGTESGVELAEIGEIAYPLLVAGFVGLAAASEDLELTLAWPRVRVHYRGGGAQIHGARRDVNIETAVGMRCWQHAGAAGAAANVAAKTGARSESAGAQHAIGVEADVWRRLEQYAHLTYVEASAESRLSGAGAGLHDND